MRGWRSTRTPRWSRLRFARRSALGHRRGQSLALVAVSALVTACVAFAPVYDRAMQQALVDTLLAHASPAERTVTVQSESLVDAGGATEPRDPRDLEAMVPPGVAVRLEQTVLGRTAVVTPQVGEVPPIGPLVWREGACEHVRVLSGTCPVGPGEILVSAADVENFRLALGATSRVGPAVDGDEAMRLEVVGTYEPQDAAWWQGLQLVGLSSISHGTDPTAAHDAWLTTEETFAVGPLLPGETSQAGALVRTELTGVDELLTLGDRVGDLTPDLRRQGPDLHVLTDLETLTDSVRAQTRLAHRTVPVLMAPMAVLTLFALWLVLAAATEQRRGEVAVARLRGRGRAGAVGLLLLELLPVLLVGVVPGAAVALLGGALARSLLPGTAPLEAGPGFVTAVALAGVAMVLTTAAAAARVAREPLESLVRSGRASAGRWAFGVLDAFLVAGVATGVVAFVTGSLRGPLALAGPALVALLAGLVLAHLAAPAASVWGRRLLRRGRLVAGVTLLETGRRRETRAVVVVITVAVALAVFAVDAVDVGARNRTNAGEHEAGAPVVLSLAGRDLDAVRAALATAEPTGHLATPVLVSRTTLAVEPDGFRRIAFFPRGAPSEAEWRAIAPPDEEPLVLTGSRFSLRVRTGQELTAEDALGSDSELGLNLVVTTGTGTETRRTVRLGAAPEPGGSTTLVGRDPSCEGGCRLAAVQLTAAPGVDVDGGLELSDLRVDGRRVAWGSSTQDWNTTEDQYTLIRPALTASGALHLLLSTRGIYPAEVTPTWVPLAVPALVPTGVREAGDVEVTGIDGSERSARVVGRVTLIPSMPRRSALVDLDAISRGAEVTFDAHLEVWLVDDPDTVADVTASLRERGIGVDDVRRYSSVRQTYDDTVPAWSLAMGAVIGPAAILVALLILLVLAVTGWRERARDLAILRLNGAGQRTTRRLAVWAQLPAVLLAVVAGVAAALVGAMLAMPDLSFFPEEPEVPVVDAATSWPVVLYVAGACLALLPAAAVLAGRVVVRRAHLERVRETG